VSDSHIPANRLRKLCVLDDAGERTLEMAVRHMGLSARAHNRILKVARTIADLGVSETVSAKHVAEAVHDPGLDLGVRGRNHDGEGFNSSDANQLCISGNGPDGRKQTVPCRTRSGRQAGGS
jgi:magnesium chelatase family protein